MSKEDQIEQIIGIIIYGDTNGDEYDVIAEDIWNLLLLKPESKPIEQIFDNEADCKAMYALFVAAGYDTVPYKAFIANTQREGFDTLREVIKIIDGIEALGYTFKTEDK